MKKLLLLLVAVAALTIPASAKAVPSCPPDGIDDLLELLENNDADELLETMVLLMDEFYKSDDSLNARIRLDDQSQSVVLSMVDEEFDGLSDVVGYEEIVKNLFLRSFLNAGGDESVTLVGLIAVTDRNLEIRLYERVGQTTPAVFIYSPDELIEAITED